MDLEGRHINEANHASSRTILSACALAEATGSATAGDAVIGEVDQNNILSFRFNQRKKLRADGLGVSVASCHGRFAGVEAGRLIIRTGCLAALRWHTTTS